MVKQFRKSACFLTVLGLLFSFSFGAGSSYAMEKEHKSKAASTTLSNSQVMTEEDDEYYGLNIDWGFDEDEYLESEEEDLQENGFDYIVNDRNEAVITYYYDLDDDFNPIGDKNLVIPDTLGGYPVTMIYDYAFSLLEATESITIPEGVKVIGDSAFSECTGLKTINIPNTVTTIDDMAFAMNDSLQKVVIPDNVVELGIGVLAINENLTDVTLPSNINKIPAVMFAYCTNLQKIDIPSSVTNIEDGAFAGTGFTEFTVPDTVNTIGDYAFSECEKLEKVTIPASVTKIGEGIFEECTKEVVIYGEKGSYAETYANKNKIPFKATNEDPVVDPDEEVIATGVTTGTLNVRSGASTSYDKIGYLAKGTKVEIVNKESNGWYKIKYNGSYGYVSGKYVQLDGQASEVIATGVTTGTLNVRSGASTSYAKIGYLAKGTKIEVVNKESNGWYKIKYNGSYGYVSGKYVKLDGQVSEVIATGVTTAGLNVRKGASTSYSKIGYLTKGTKIEVVEKLSNGWYKIKYNGSYGYVSGKYVKLDGQVSEVIATGVTTAGLNVRKGSSTSYSKIGYLAKGSKVEIVTKLSNGWYKIKYNGSYGYVSGAYVKLS